MEHKFSNSVYLYLTNYIRYIIPKNKFLLKLPDHFQDDDRYLFTMWENNVTSSSVTGNIMIFNVTSSNWRVAYNENVCIVSQFNLKEYATK